MQKLMEISAAAAEDNASGNSGFSGDSKEEEWARQSALAFTVRSSIASLCHALPVPSSLTYVSTASLICTGNLAVPQQSCERPDRLPRPQLLPWRTRARAHD